MKSNQRCFCGECNQEVFPSIKIVDGDVLFRGEKFSLSMLVAYCETCGEEFLTHDTHDVNLNRVREIYAKKHG